MKSESGVKNGSSPYRLERLPVVPAHRRQARQKQPFEKGQLVYYGPMPLYYGIGEVKRVAEAFVVVDFRGTGHFDVHQELLKQEYLIRIPESKLEEL